MPLTHLDENGQAIMVDVSNKAATKRDAVATARVVMSPETMNALKNGSEKGDALAVARVAGISAAKKTSELIPLCHPLRLSSVRLEFKLDETVALVTAVVRCTGQTGVEMEALTAASVAALTLYDMLKSHEKGIVIERVQLESKTGGRSEAWHNPEV